MKLLATCNMCLRQHFRSGLSLFRKYNSTHAQQTKEILRRSRIKRISLETDNSEFKICTAYSTGESYNLQEVKDYFNQPQLHKKYTIRKLPKDATDVLHISQQTDENENGDIFLFRRLGAFVCWNLTDTELHSLRCVLKPFELNSYEMEIIEEEYEKLNFTATEQETRLVDGDIFINNLATEDQQALEKLAFSNAMALSVKLGVWETSLEEFSASLRYVPEILKRGFKVTMTRKEVLRKIGELLTLRHQINLYSDLLTTPDFYWDREDLEMLYLKMSNYLEISNRTTVINEKLNLCNELVELIRNHLNEQHGHRLEWMIIVLITIEVVFELLHVAERYF